MVEPEANWSDWPATRIGALVIDGILLILLITCFAVPWLRKRCLYNEVCYSSICCLILVVICAGVIGGMWLHFIPCIWWTCDWGSSDGEGVRGAIWAIGGVAIAVVTATLLCIRRVKKERESPV